MTETILRERNFPCQCDAFQSAMSCKVGRYCARNHVECPFCRTVCLENIFPSPSQFQRLLPKVDLKITEKIEQKYVDAVYVDLFYEAIQYGQVSDIIIAKNPIVNLCGTAFIAYTDVCDAYIACKAFNGRFYAGRKIFASLKPHGRFSKMMCSANCTQVDCNMIHPYNVSENVYQTCFPKQQKAIPKVFLKEKEEVTLDPNQVLFS
ncbi:Splicing factor U2AF 26 kDa subunit [Tritrichomonas musculus]|uniref:Splicing factor U2AF 26 kDa subunit n=1 Tax=Tritrichomonas musculus TaxID=1915356 RepID=A0ABR2JZV7_9EUKA